MSHSTYDLLLEDSMFERLCSEQDPGLLKVTVDVLGRLRAREFYDPAFADAVFQKSERFPITLTDAYGFLLVYTNVLAGRWRIARIPVGNTPRPDKETEENNVRLQGLDSQFGAVFEGGSGDHDGSFWWHDHLHLGGCLLVDDQLVDGPPVTVGPAKLVLEVGYQAVGKTLAMMRQYKALARWPYDSDCIWVFCNRSVPSKRFQEIETTCKYDQEHGWACAYSRGLSGSDT